MPGRLPARASWPAAPSALAASSLAPVTSSSSSSSSWSSSLRPRSEEAPYLSCLSLAISSLRGEPQRSVGLAQAGPGGRSGGRAGTGVPARAETLGRDPYAGDLYVFRGRRGDLLKIAWHDGIGMSLYAKRLERGRFIWPSPADGCVAISGSQ